MPLFSKLFLNVSSLSLKNRVVLRNIGHNYMEPNKFIQGVHSVKIRHENSNSWPSTDKNSKETSKSSRASHIVRLKNDPDVFGHCQDGPEVFNGGDLAEERHFTEQMSGTKKLSTKEYADIIKRFIRNRNIKEAIDVVEVRMLKEDKVTPENYIYNLLIGACGRVGYTKKAFSLYNIMKKRRLTVTGGTYTALFNACANSPWPQTDGLTRAKHLYDIMIEKGYQANDTNYNVMIKAFAKCGDIPMAFSLVDGMLKNGLTIKDDTINFLLQACICDKDAGFRHSLLVWRKMIDKRITPSLYTFNLMLRCIRDCGLGNIEATIHVIDKLVGASYSKQSEIESPNQDFIDEPHKPEEVGNILGKTANNNRKAIHPMISTHDSSRPNLMSKVPHMGNILSLSEVRKADDRLVLVGGAQGFLETMKHYKCTPDIKTFAQLLDCIPSTNASEKELLVSMKKFNVKPDIDLYNMLIKKRCMRCDYEGAKEVLVRLKQQRYRPNLVTYGVLALGCKNKEEALELVEEMKSASYRLNSEILGAMLQQACYHYNFGYVFEIMELCISETIPVNRKFLQHLEKFKKDCKEKIQNKELIPQKEKSFGIFKARYKLWLDQVQKDETEEAHPWQQFRQESHGDGVNKYKEKGICRYFKPRRASKFKVKTSDKTRY